MLKQGTNLKRLAGDLGVCYLALAEACQQGAYRDRLSGVGDALLARVAGDSSRARYTEGSDLATVASAYHEGYWHGDSLALDILGGA